jgi:hypothetical protein
MSRLFIPFHPEPLQELHPNRSLTASAPHGATYMCGNAVYPSKQPLACRLRRYIFALSSPVNVICSCADICLLFPFLASLLAGRTALIYYAISKVADVSLRKLAQELTWKRTLRTIFVKRFC